MTIFSAYFYIFFVQPIKRVLLKLKTTVYKSYARSAIVCERESLTVNWMGIQWRTEGSMMRAVCGVQLNDRKRVKDFMLLYYHRRPGMIAEAWKADELVTVGHCYGGLGGSSDGGGGWYACGTKPMGWSHVRRCRSTSRVCGKDNGDTRSHRLPGALHWVGWSRNWSVLLGRP